MGHKYDRGWDTKPSLAEQRFYAPEAARAQPAKKNTRKWCKGRVGIEHVPEVRDNKNYYWMLAQGKVRCHWEPRHHWRSYLAAGRRWVADTDEGVWSCYHERACTHCGKILSSWGVGEDCPLWVPKPDKLPCDCRNCKRALDQTD